MLRVAVLFAMLFWVSGDQQEHLQEFNVSGIQCQHVAKKIMPWDVDTDARRYIDSCVEWHGIVGAIVDADLNETKAWIVPIEGKFAYCGSTLLTVNFLGATGTDLFSSYETFLLCDFLCTPRPPTIERGDPVSFTGKILGISRRPDPAQSGHLIERVLIGIIEIHKIEWEREVR